MLRLTVFFFLSLFYACGQIFACDGTSVVVDVRNVRCNGTATGSIRVFSTFTSEFLPYQYSLNGGIFVSDSIFNNLPAGSYSISVRNGEGCILDLSPDYVIAEPEALRASAVGRDVICGNDGSAFPVVSGGIPPYLYTWRNGVIVNIDTLRNIAQGSYQVVVEDQNGCVDSATVNIGGPEPFSVSIIPEEPLVEYGSSLSLEVLVNRSSGTYSYQWFPEGAVSCGDCPTPAVNVFSDTEIRVFVTDLINGCKGSDTALVVVEGRPGLFVPNAFSPNGDGRNDFFTVYGVGIISALVEVYDSRGFKLYEGTLEDEGWNGTINGYPAMPGVYYYIVDVSFADQSRERKKGALTLIR